MKLVKVAHCWKIIFLPDVDESFLFKKTSKFHEGGSSVHYYVQYDLTFIGFGHFLNSILIVKAVLPFSIVYSSTICNDILNECV